MKVGDKTVHTAAEGNGPVNALDNALRKALESFYPRIKSMHLSDYKVRVFLGHGRRIRKHHRSQLASPRRQHCLRPPITQKNRPPVSPSRKQPFFYRNKSIVVFLLI